MPASLTFEFGATSPTRPPSAHRLVPMCLFVAHVCGTQVSSAFGGELHVLGESGCVTSWQGPSPAAAVCSNVPACGVCGCVCYALNTCLCHACCRLSATCSVQCRDQHAAANPAVYKRGADRLVGLLCAPHTIHCLRGHQRLVC